MLETNPTYTGYISIAPSGGGAYLVAKDNRFKSLIATGRVRIVQGEREASCDRAEVMPGDFGGFQFYDAGTAAVEAGATAVIQPGGSIRDEYVIKAADEAGLAMVFTGMRHFRH